MTEVATPQVRRQRQRLVQCLEDAAKRLHEASYASKPYDDDPDCDWPSTEPVPDQLWELCDQLDAAIDAVDAGIADTKRVYRKRVLVWLLAEVDA